LAEANEAFWRNNQAREMCFLRHLPIKRKLMAITMLASGIALVVACLAFFACEQVTARKRIVQDLTVTARMTGANSTAGLVFDDAASVEQTLKSLSVQPSIVAACVYDKDGRPFAFYQRADAQDKFSPPPIESGGHHFGPNRLDLFQKIELAGETVGTMYLRMDLREMSARIWRYLLIVAAVLLASVLVAFVLSTALRRLITEPLGALAETVMLVAEQKNYSVRAVKQGDDELGRLIDGFNHMLAQVQERDNALEAVRGNLENRVRERTQVLAYERDLLETLMDTLPDSIYFKDLDSRFVRVSRSKLQKSLATALARHKAATPADGSECLPRHLAGPEHFVEHLIGKTDFDFMTEASARSAYEAEQEIIRTGKPLIGKIERIERLSGKVEWMLSSKLPWHDKEGRIIGTFGSSKDITAMKEAEAKLEEVHRQLLETSREAGMAEVATSVLHNVGNVLNSVNTSVSVMADILKASNVSGVARLAGLFDEHRNDLGGFLARDNRSETVPNYLNALAQHLASMQAKGLRELQELTRNVEHVKEIVAMQQSYAKVCGVVEMHSMTELVEDALRLQAGGLARHGVRVARHFDNLPDVLVEKHKVLQILINLFSNAKYALSGADVQERRLSVSVRRKGENRFCISVADNGMGIAPENLTRIFAHGFTTRRDGHGFGLHSGALAAREMGGTLLAQSDGLGKGATFTLELPLQLQEQPLPP
jgi:signal transduction histidine kinase/HAMP domain-containing protein